MSQQKKILVTGASGFVGAALVERLAAAEDCQVLALVRRDGVTLPPNSVPVRVSTDYLAADLPQLSGVDVLIHCAARVHVMFDAYSDPLTEYRKINVDGTMKLAERAASAGVKRFIFLSSIKVNGEGTRPDVPYTADDVPAPRDPYGVSKMEAEQRLRGLAERTDMEVVIIRPVLVYGPGVKANFRSMMSWLNKSAVLPMKTIHNQRSLVALDNLIDLIVTCVYHPRAANQTFLVSDGEDMSTTDLLIRMGNALGKPARLVPMPAVVLICAASLIGRKAVGRRLCGSLQVDIEKTRQLLGWAPPVPVDSALCKTAKSFQGSLE